MKKKFIIGTALVLFGWASSAPIPTGKETYMISRQSAAGVFVAANSIKADIFREASAFCAAQDKEFQVVSAIESSAIPFTPRPSSEVRFNCVDENRTS